MQRITWITLLFVVLLLTGCQQTAVPEPDEELSGGQGTIFNTTPNAFGSPLPGLEREQELLFFVGNSFFNQNWVTAPASTTARDGLGPLFNARSCAGCHFKDGRGRPPETDGELTTGFLVRLSVPDANDLFVPDSSYGDQIQDQAIMGLSPEATIRLEYAEIPFTFPDGTTASLRQPSLHFEHLLHGDLPADTRFSPRVASQMIGLGLLEAVPEETILALADPDDADNDGISGRPNWVWDAATNEMALGRFGWKANQPSLAQQTAAAFLGDMGITTPLFPAENCRAGDVACETAVTGGTPEIEADDFRKVVLYVQTLAVPARRDWTEPQMLAGKVLFTEIGCAACHTPLLETGSEAALPALAQQTIRPYTDMLLHDMGEGLADGRPDFTASGSEWRTPPLWGIGLIETVNGHTNLLHDGRARNLEEAILWHGGEAETSRDAYTKLTPAEREALLRFLGSL